MADPRIYADSLAKFGGELADLRRQLRNLQTPTENQFNRVVQYLTGSTGFAKGSGEFFLNLSKNSGTFDSPTWSDWDSALCPEVKVAIPSSGRVRVNLGAWIHVMVNAYAPGTFHAVKARGIVAYDVLDEEGNLLWEHSMGSGPQIALRIWGENASVSNGLRFTTTAIHTDTPESVRIFRPRIGYYGFAQNGDNDTIDMPAGSFAEYLIEQIEIATNPM